MKSRLSAIRSKKMWTKTSIFFVALLLTIQVFVSNTLSTMGETITQYDQEITTLKEENYELKQKIASASSLMVTEKKASVIGFTENVNPVFLSEELPVAVHLP